MDDNPHPDSPSPDDPGAPGPDAGAPGPGPGPDAGPGADFGADQLRHGGPGISGPANALAAVRRWVLPVAVPAIIALAIAAGVDFINRHATTSDEAGKKPGRAGRAAAAPSTGQPVRDGPAPALMAKGRPLPRRLAGVNRSGTAVVVRDVRTLATVARVPAPPQRRFRQVAEAGLDSSSYVVSASAVGGTAFYRLRIPGDGRPGPLSPVPRTWLPGASTQWSDMAVSERGDTIAYVSYQSSPQRKIAIDVVPTAGGGSRRTWTTSLAGRIGGLSWAGRTLSFVWTPMRGKTVLRHQVRTLDTSRPPGDLKISRPVRTLPDGADTAVMSQDGSMVVTGVAARDGLELAAYSAADGRRTGVLWRRPGESPPRVAQLVADGASGDLIVMAADGRLLIGPAHGGTAFAAADLADVAW